MLPITDNLGFPFELHYTKVKSSLNKFSLDECKELERKFIDLYYPTQKDLRELDIYHNPSTHFYFCYDTCQVFLRKVRSKFVVSCRGFVPAGCSFDDVSFVSFTNVGTFSDLDAAITRYRSLCLEVLDRCDVENVVPF